MENIKFSKNNYKNTDLLNNNKNYHLIFKKTEYFKTFFEFVESRSEVCRR